ncbi:unnamed protein product, partial [Prorocentrum cordatum]
AAHKATRKSKPGERVKPTARMLPPTVKEEVHSEGEGAKASAGLASARDGRGREAGGGAREAAGRMHKRLSERVEGRPTSELEDIDRDCQRALSEAERALKEAEALKARVRDVRSREENAVQEPSAIEEQEKSMSSEESRRPPSPKRK